LVESDGYQASVGSQVGEVALSFSDRIVILPPSAGPELEAIGTQFLKAVSEIVAEDRDAGMVLGEAQDRVRTVLQSP